MSQTLDLDATCLTPDDFRLAIKGVPTVMKLAAFADEISTELDEQISSCGENNITHFELRGVYGKNVLDFDKSIRNEIKTRLNAQGMGVACIGSPIGKVKISNPWEAHFERFKIAVETAEFFDAPFIRIFSYYPPSESEDIATFREEVIRRMRAKVDFVKNRNVTLVHENEKGIFGSTAKACLDLLKTIDSPKFRAAFDCANMVQVKERPLDAWPSMKPYVVHFHVKDARMGDGKVTLAGHGDGDLEAILVHLHKSGYDGFLSMEPHLKAAEQFSGFSGPALFKVAVDALKALCRKNNIPLAGV